MYTRSCSKKRPQNKPNEGQEESCARTAKMIKLWHTGCQPQACDFVKPNNKHHHLHVQHQQQQLKQSSHKPFFVTIEGFRVASYSIGGEPHLCLPQLLQYLKQNFTIKRLIDKFEESVITFASATPKQVEGFVKASVLPPNANSCPLIKRSDADKICLGLYEQCLKARRGDIVSLCSKSPLFKSEAQNPILALAKAVTSTLIIQVYHKCFGKCVGFYYPSLLMNSNSKCIECANCKIMLSPRRFVGHTHGPKENDVCHWGFNSYNWRSYIHIKRKQTQNNLDDDELLIQLKTLFSVPNDETIEDDEFEFDKQELDELCSVPENRIKDIKVEQHEESSSSLNLSSQPKPEANNLVGIPAMYAPPINQVGLPGGKLTFDVPLPVPLSWPAETMEQVSRHQLEPSIPPDYYPSPGWNSLAAQASTAQTSLSFNSETKRELYICNNLTSYLRNKGLSLGQTNDIVEITLSIVRRSKTLS